MFDIDTCNTIVAEERSYRKWVREQKNRILNISNYDSKVQEWKKLFPKIEHSEIPY